MPIVCSDRGQHSPTRLARFDRHADGTRRVSGPYRSWFPPFPEGSHEDADELADLSRESYSFCCMNCGRTPRVNVDKFIHTYVRRAFDAGLNEVDVSWLPL